MNLQTQSPIISQPISKLQAPEKAQQKFPQQQQVPQSQTPQQQSTIIQQGPQQTSQQGMFSQKLQPQQQANPLTIPIQQQPMMAKGLQQVQPTITSSTMFSNNISKQATSTPTQLGSAQPKQDTAQSQQPAAQKALFPTGAPAKPPTNSLFNAPASAAPDKPATNSLFNAQASAAPAKPATNSLLNAPASAAPAKPSNTPLFNSPAAATATKAPPANSLINAAAPATQALFSFSLNKGATQPDKNATSIFNTPTKADQAKKDDQPVDQKLAEQKKIEQSTDNTEKPKPGAVKSIFSTNNLSSSSPASSAQTKPSLFGSMSSSQVGSFSFGNTSGQTSSTKPFSFDVKPADSTPSAENKSVSKNDPVKTATPVTEKEKTPTPVIMTFFLKLYFLNYYLPLFC